MTWKYTFVIRNYFFSFVAACIMLPFLHGCANDSDYDFFADIHGTVTDAYNGTAVAGALVSISPAMLNTMSAADGTFSFYDLDAGQYTITVMKEGYYTNRATVYALSGTETDTHITLTPITH